MARVYYILLPSYVSSNTNSHYEMSLEYFTDISTDISGQINAKSGADIVQMRNVYIYV